jgi:hypothetical protein
MIRYTCRAERETGQITLPSLRFKYNLTIRLEKSKRTPKKKMIRKTSERYNLDEDVTNFRLEM